MVLRLHQNNTTHPSIKDEERLIESRLGEVDAHGLSHNLKENHFRLMNDFLLGDFAVGL